MRQLALPALLALASCSGGEHITAAEQAIAALRIQTASGDFDDIHAGAAPAWKKAVSEEQTEQMFRAIQRKLGSYKSGERGPWRVNYGTSGTVTVIEYRSQFERGPATETFTFQSSGKNAQLLAYNINSPVLLTS